MPATGGAAGTGIARITLTAIATETATAIGTAIVTVATAAMAIATTHTTIRAYGRSFRSAIRAITAATAGMVATAGMDTRRTDTAIPLMGMDTATPPTAMATVIPLTVMAATATTVTGITAISAAIRPQAPSPVA